MSVSAISDGELLGQVAVVTGAGRGIGRAIALALARAGASVAGAARSRDQLDETLALIRKDGGEAICFAIDVTDRSAVDFMAEETSERFGPIGLLVNCAGVAGVDTPLWKADPDDWWRVIEVNLRGPFLCARAVLPGMIARGEGRIINVGSGAGLDPSEHYSAYVVSKTALLRLGECLDQMTKPLGVRTFTISPGVVRTSMTDGKALFADIPASEWFAPERAAELCVLLASGKADRLSGRFLTVRWDTEDLLRRIDDVEADELYTLRLRAE